MDECFFFCQEEQKHGETTGGQGKSEENPVCFLKQRCLWSAPVSEHHNIYLFLKLLRKVEIIEVAEYLCDHFRR